MNICSGNLSIRDIENRLGIKLKADEVKFLEETYCSSADVKKGTWHCFDIPFRLDCYDKPLAEKMLKIFEPYSKEMRECFQIGFVNE